MPTYDYTYSISNDTANGAVDLPRLESEIRSSAITVALDAVSTQDTDIVATFKDELSSPEEIELNQLVANHSGAPFQNPVNEAGIPYFILYGADNKVQTTKPVGGNDLIRSSHNLADKCTWYAESVRISNEVLSDSGDGKTFSSAYTHWVDLKTIHAAASIKAEAVASLGHDYSPTVLVDGAEMTERPLFATDWADGGDYYVDHATGNVVFKDDQAGNTVRASYSYATTSEWYLIPRAGKVIEISDSEAQFSEGIEMTDRIEFVLEMPDGQGGWTTLGYQYYDCVPQIIDEARGAYPVIPATPGPRGNSEAVRGFPFEYLTIRDIYSSLGMRLRVSLSNHREFVGSRATMTLYAVSSDE